MLLSLALRSRKQNCVVHTLYFVDYFEIHWQLTATDEEKSTRSANKERRRTITNNDGLREMENEHYVRRRIREGEVGWDFFLNFV